MLSYWLNSESLQSNWLIHAYTPPCRPVSDNIIHNERDLRIVTLLQTVPKQLHHFIPMFRIQIHRIHMFLGLPDPDPDPLFRGMDAGFGSFYHQAKIVRKSLIPTVLCLLLKNDIIGPSKSNKQKNFFLN
jgi:hypothetical protein